MESCTPINLHKNYCLLFNNGRFTVSGNAPGGLCENMENHQCQGLKKCKFHGSEECRKYFASINIFECCPIPSKQREFKLPEPTLKERIDILIRKYEHVIINVGNEDHHVHVDGKAEEAKALLREIVDYVVEKHGFVCKMGIKTTGDIYKELDIDE